MRLALLLWKCTKRASGSTLACGGEQALAYEADVVLGRGRLQPHELRFLDEGADLVRARHRVVLLLVLPRELELVPVVVGARPRLLEELRGLHDVLGEGDARAFGERALALERGLPVGDGVVVRPRDELLHLRVLVDEVGHVVLRELRGPRPSRDDVRAGQRIALDAEHLVALAPLEIGPDYVLHWDFAAIDEVHRPVRCVLPLVIRLVQSRAVLLTEEGSPGCTKPPRVPLL